MSTQAENLSVGLCVGLAAGEIVERHLGGFDYVVGYERGALFRALLGTLETAFPFEDGPAVVACLGEQGEYPSKIHLSVTE